VRRWPPGYSSTTGTGKRFPGKVRPPFVPSFASPIRRFLAKDFIKLLLSPDPTKRPTATGALSAHVRTLFDNRPPREAHTTHSGLLSTPRQPRLTYQVSAKTSTHVPAGSLPSTPPGLSSGSMPAPTLPNPMDPAASSGGKFQATMMMTMTVSLYQRRGNRVRQLRRFLPGRLDHRWAL